MSFSGSILGRSDRESQRKTDIIAFPNTRDLFAIASNEPVDIALVKQSLSSHLWKRKDIMGISLEITHCQESVRIGESFEVTVKIINHAKYDSFFAALSSKFKLSLD